jgi:transposase-like protein
METTSKFVCDTCKFTTNYKNVIDKHLSSKKHREKHDIETADKYSHVCNKCNKTYSTYSGLWKHQKKCTEEQQTLLEGPQNTNTIENAIQMEMIEQPLEPDDDFQTKIKMNIIKILLDHVNRDELNKIIDEIYDGK